MTSAPTAVRSAPVARDESAAEQSTDGRTPLDLGLCVSALVASAAAVAVGALSLSLNSLDVLGLPLMIVLALSMGALAWRAPGWDDSSQRFTIALAAGAAAGALVLAIAPEWIYGHEMNGIIHHSFLSAVLLLAVGLPALSTAIYHALGATPTAWDVSRYPLILFPIALALVVYCAILLRLLVSGAPDLSFDLITTPYSVELTDTEFLREAGLRNHLAGTILLVAMTCALAVPIGVGAGVCMAEYGGALPMLIRFATLMLRAVSVFILAVTAFTLADWSSGYAPGDWRSDLLRGFYTENGFKIAGHGSFLTASIILSMLVIPVIARTTEEGFRSVPRDIREGSIALGATEGHGFLRVLLPWSLPNIITGVLLGAAEAAGSLAVLLFIAGSGEHGVGPLREVTSLSYLVYYADRGPKSFIDIMGTYQESAALVLVFLTFALSVGALMLKQRFGTRYRGAQG